MSDSQLWIAVSIPSILVILGWMQTNVRLANIEKDVKQIVTDLHTFNFIQGKHDEAIGTLKAKIL